MKENSLNNKTFGQLDDDYDGGGIEVKPKEERLKSLERGEEITFLSQLYDKIERATLDKAWFQNDISHLKWHFIDKVKEAEAFNGKFVIIYEGFEEMVLVHEVLHCMRLSHSFAAVKEHSFKAIKTDNIMDYAIQGQRDPRESLWKWQWEKLWEWHKNK